MMTCTAILPAFLASAAVRLTRYSHTFGNSVLSLKVRDVHGNAWVGRSAPGMYIKLRRVKS